MTDRDIWREAIETAARKVEQAGHPALAVEIRYLTPPAAMRPAEGWRPMRPADFGNGDRGDLWVVHPEYGERREVGCVYLEDAPITGFTGWVFGDEHFQADEPVEDNGWIVTHWMPEPAAPAHGGEE